MWTVPEDNKESLLPSEIKLSRSDAGSLTLEMTKSNAADKVKSYSLNYEIICGEKKKEVTRSLGLTEGSTVFIPNYNNLFVGENTVKITFTAKPTESALKNGYTEEQTMFTATVNYKVNAPISHKGISAQIADAPTAGMKTLTVQGLTANRSYRIAARGGESGKVNYRNGVTDGNGTFTSSWYTDYSFDHCTIEEWAVSVVTNTEASIVSTPYSGEIMFTP